ncbi:MAG: type II secretion system F family protein [Desulfarculaceae bacterium]|jgi:tight adherence protein C
MDLKYLLMNFNLDLVPVLLSLAAGFAVLLMFGAASMVFMREDPALRRVRDLQQGGLDAENQDLPQRLRSKALEFLIQIARPAIPRQPWEISRVRRDLMVAGFQSSSAMNIYLGLKVFSLALMPCLIFLTPLPGKLQGALLPLVMAGSAALGFMLPSLVLTRKGNHRRDKISKELPDVLDLLVIAVEAGLGLDAAIRRVAKEVRGSSPVLARELTLVSLELRAGIARERALKNLAVRCGVDEMTSLVNMLNQADRYGVSVGRSLRIHSDSVRTKRKQKTKELAAKIPLKLLFPVLFLIFPAIMLVMAGPAILRVTETIMH